MMSENNQLDDEFEKLKRERDTLLLKHEIQQLKKAENKEQDRKNLYKKILINSAKAVVYLLALLGAVLFFIGVAIGQRAKMPEIVSLSLLLILPLIIMFIKQRSNTQNEIEEDK